MFYLQSSYKPTTVCFVSRSHSKLMSVLNVMLLRTLSTNLTALFSQGRNGGLSISNLGQYGSDALKISYGNNFTAMALSVYRHGNVTRTSECYSVSQLCLARGMGMQFDYNMLSLKRFSVYCNWKIDSSVL